MALIQKGALTDCSATPAASVLANYPALVGIRTFATLPQTLRAAQPLPVQFQTSDSARGLALKSLRLTKGFAGFIGNLLNATNEVYFLAWAWDFSGRTPVVYPDPATNAAEA